MVKLVATLSSYGRRAVVVGGVADRYAGELARAGQSNRRRAGTGSAAPQRATRPPLWPAGMAEGNRATFGPRVGLSSHGSPAKGGPKSKCLARVKIAPTSAGPLSLTISDPSRFPRAGQPVKVYLMTAVLGHSRRLYCRAFLAQRQDDWLEGLEGAFQHFGGLTEQVLCDNASPLVTSHDRQSGQVVWNPGFETFCRDRGLTAKACRPRRARTKGKIERGVGYVKHNEGKAKRDRSAIGDMGKQKSCLT